MRLAGEGVQILRLQAVKRRESPENCEIERSFIHQTIRRRLWFQPYDFGCESYHMRRQVRPPSGSQLLPSGVRPKALAILSSEFFEPCRDIGNAALFRILQGPTPKRRKAGGKYGSRVQ